MGKGSKGGSVGVSTGTIIHTKSTEQRKKDRIKAFKKNSRKKRQATQCIKCEHNDNGFCKKVKRWCSIARKECNEF